MLNENIKIVRKSKGLSQEELAIKLNVVRQTVSKWEKGLSVPDAEMLLLISEYLETPVSTLLGESITKEREDDLKVISKKLEVINLQLSKSAMSKRKIFHIIFILLSVIIVGIFAVLLFLNSPYSMWDYTNPETAVLGVAFHSLEWIFVRLAPIALIGLVIGAFLTRKK